MIKTIVIIVAVALIVLLLVWTLGSSKQSPTALHYACQKTISSSGNVSLGAFPTPVCVPDPNGTFTDLTSCQSVCTTQVLANGVYKISAPVSGSPSYLSFNGDISSI